MPPSSGQAATLSVELDGTATALPWPPGTRMLDVLIAAGLDAPYSCRQGICGACACQLVAGEVEMAHNEVLEAADLADGYILACQAVPLTPEVRVDLLSEPPRGWAGPAAYQSRRQGQTEAATNVCMRPVFWLVRWPPRPRRCRESGPRAG